MDKKIILQAKKFASEAHKGQKRKFSSISFIEHLSEVTNILAKSGSNPATIAAGWLHDTVEDTQVELKDIENIFGIEIAQYVFFLTDCGLNEGNRRTRKAKDRARLASAPADVQSIKLADLIANAPSIIKADPKFAKVFIKEMELLLPCLEEGNKSLIIRAKKVIDSYYEESRV